MWVLRRFWMFVTGGFFLALLMVAQLDYSQQAFLRGDPKGGYGLAGWAQSVVARTSAVTRRISLEVSKGDALRDHLPEAPSGWQRLDWDPRFTEALVSGAIQREAPRRAASDGGTHVERVVAGIDRDRWDVDDRAMKKESWVYASGRKLVILRASFFDPRYVNGDASAVEVVQRGIDARKYSPKPQFTLDGVAFYRMRFMGTRNDKVREFHASLGNEVQFSIMTNAPYAELKPLLRGIRYDDLRALLDQS